MRKNGGRRSKGGCFHGNYHISSLLSDIVLGASTLTHSLLNVILFAQISFGSFVSRAASVLRLCSRGFAGTISLPDTRTSEYIASKFVHSFILASNNSTFAWSLRTFPYCYMQLSSFFPLVSSNFSTSTTKSYRLFAPSPVCGPLHRPHRSPRNTPFQTPLTSVLCYISHIITIVFLFTFTYSNQLRTKIKELWNDTISFDTHILNVATGAVRLTLSTCRDDSEIETLLDAVPGYLRDNIGSFLKQGVIRPLGQRILHFCDDKVTKGRW